MHFFVTVWEFFVGANRADVYVELIRTVGITVTAICSLVAAWIAADARRTSRRVETKVDARRHEVRSHDTPGDQPPIVIVREGAPRENGNRHSQ